MHQAEATVEETVEEPASTIERGELHAPGAISGRSKLPWSYRRPDAVRDDLLARLLALNAQRYAQEVALGLHSNAGDAGDEGGEGQCWWCFRGHAAGEAAQSQPAGRDWRRSQRADGVGVMNNQAATTAPTPADLLSLLRSHRQSWEKRFHLRRIGLFGSTARNEATAASDVDVWVELDPLTPFATVHLKQELEALLQRPVDLVRLRERMNPALRQAILREGVSA